MLKLKQIIFSFVFALAFLATSAQIFDPVKWDYNAYKKSNGSYELVFKSTIEPGWHVYSQFLESDMGPIATEFVFEKTNNVDLTDTVNECEPHTEFDPNFEMDLNFFSNEATWWKNITVIENHGDTIKGYFTYMVCDSLKCLPPTDVDFQFILSESQNFSDDIITCEEQAHNNVAGSIDSHHTENEDDEKDGSLWGIFFISFLSGFAALLTPCVFPMIPMTVSFFTKQSKTKAKGITNAIIYGAFIIGIYTILGYLVTLFFGADALNALSTNVWFNLAFFVLLIVFAFSFLGAFEITLPSSWVNKADSASDKGGLIGIFFMAFTLALVSFSCTGPIIGTLLVEAAVHGDTAGPMVGMAGFSLALALPFALFAAFPGWLNSLPKSGGWLNSVKVVLGFLEIALAFKFLSNADLVVQGGYLQREVFIAIWIAVSLMITMYLLGKIQLPHDSKLERISVGRGVTAMVFLMFTIYLIPGMWGAPLKLISGFPPPMHYSESPRGLGGGSSVSNEVIPEGADPDHCPHQLNCFHDYEEGMAYAKEINKPVLIDFTGHACVNCRKMEEQVWSDPKVLSILKNDVVLISLYVDQKTELPEEDKYVSETTGKKIRTVGNKWSDFQIKNFGSNSQPQYAILKNNSIKPVNGSTSYDPDIQLYIDWLKEGIKKAKH